MAPNTIHVRYQIRRIYCNCKALKFDYIRRPAIDSSIPVIYCYNFPLNDELAQKMINNIFDFACEFEIVDDLFPFTAEQKDC